jgi:hypothetical protein
MQKENLRMRTRSIVAGLATLVASAAVAAEPGPFVGEWHWNGTASVGAPGEPKPRDVVLSITSADAAHVAWRLTMTDETGERHEQSFNGTGDGKPVAVSGNTTGSMAAFTVTPTALQSVYTYPDGATDRSTCALSADQKTMTCHGVESDGKGHTAPYTDVYDRK